MRLGEYGLGNRVSGRAASIPGDETGANPVLAYNQTWIACFWAWATTARG